MMRWWWFGPSVTNAQLARELTAMKEAGIGGVEIQPVYPLALDDDAKGIKNLPFLSDDFLGALRFASKTARDLGLRVDLTLGSGWPFGGPQVSIADAAGRLRVERVPIAAGQRRVALPSLQDGERMFSTVIAEMKGDAIVPDSVRDLAERERRDDRRWRRGAEDAVRSAAHADGLHQQPHRHDGEARGDRLGRLRAESLRSPRARSLSRVRRRSPDDRVRQGAARHRIAIFCDSLEVFGSDWTDDFLDAFQQKRGYDLRPHLPALAADMGPKTAAIRHDWGLTLTELLHERFLAPMKEWSAKQQTRFRVQGYGIPPATLSSNAFADLPEGEGYQWRTLTSSRWAASASHIYGQPVASSETWTWLHSPSYRATPLDMKAEADLHFLQGITQLIGHGWPYTSEGVDYPGWRFYAAAVFNDSNPWFIAMPDVSRYLQRVSFMMRQGAPANDVAFYLPVSDAYASFTVGRSIHLLDVLKERIGAEVMGRIFDAGFNLDLVDDDALRLAGKVDGDALVLGSGNGQWTEPLSRDRAAGRRAPSARHAAHARCVRARRRHVDRHAPPARDRAGLPRDGCGARGSARHDRASVHRPERAREAGRRRSGDRRGAASSDAARCRDSLARPPASSARLVSCRVGIVHRRLPYADVYFIANTSNRLQHAGGDVPCDAQAGGVVESDDGRDRRGDARTEPRMAADG